MTSTRSERALALFGEGCNCAQAVLGAFAPGLGMTEENALRVATGFGGGMGRTSGTCGAVTGACMALGLMRGMRKTGEAAAKEATYEAVQDFVQQFKEAHGSVACTELLGVDLGTPEGRTTAKEQGLFAARCNGYVRDAVLILEDVSTT
jgi:C_GCAxxG_C_C family probable redox protein